MMIAPQGSKENLRKFWVVVSFIGLCVCGAMALYCAVGGFWKGGGMYLFAFLCNAWTFETKRRKR